MQQGQSALLNMPSYTGGNHKQFSAQQQNPLLQQVSFLYVFFLSFTQNLRIEDSLLAKRLMIHCIIRKLKFIYTSLLPELKGRCAEPFEFAGILEFSNLNMQVRVFPLVYCSHCFCLGCILYTYAWSKIHLGVEFIAFVSLEFIMKIRRKA